MTNAMVIPGGEIAVYQTAEGGMSVEARLERDTVWLTKQQMAALFDRERSVISKHVRNVFAENELDPAATCANFAQVRQEGARAARPSGQGLHRQPEPPARAESGRASDRGHRCTARSFRG